MIRAELEPGDLVWFENYPDYVKYTFIDWVQLEDEPDDFKVGYSELSGIEIDPDLLKLNHDLLEKIILKQEGETWRVEVWGTVIIGLRYLHEIQHILRNHGMPSKLRI